MLTSEINRVAEKTAELLGEKLDTVMSTQHCAEYMGTTPAAIRKMCDRGHIPYHKKHGRLYFFKNEINNYLKND